MSRYRKTAMFQDKGEGGFLIDVQQPTLITEQNTIPMPCPVLGPQPNIAQSENNISPQWRDQTQRFPTITYRRNDVQPQRSAIIDQETAPLPVASVPTITYRWLPKFARSFFGTILTRARKPEPEKWSHIWQHVGAKSQVTMLGWFPMLLVSDALSILMITLACVYSLRTFTDQQVFLWLGLLVIFVTSFLRMLSPIASRVERILIVCSAGLFVYLVPVILSPLHFIFVDEYLHLRNVDDIVRTGHLFNINSMLAVSPAYPGLEIITDALSSLSGLDTYISGLIVTGVARFVVVLSLFMLFEQITKSTRTAGIATMLYMCNSSFFMFDSLFIYEALGLAIGTFLLFVVAHLNFAKSRKHALFLIACLVIGVLTTVHHASDFFFIGLLILWTIVSKLLRQPLLKLPVAKITFCGLLFALLWVALIAKSVVGYLFSPVLGSFNQLTGILLGTDTGRRLFTDFTGNHPTPRWEQLVMLLALVIVTLGIPFAALCLWHSYRRKALPFMLGLISLLYPLVQSLRMTGERADIADRSAPYIFIAVSFVLAVFITQMWPTYKLRLKQAILITSLASVVFLGGSMLGAGPAWQLMPGRYLVGTTNARSIDPESIQIAVWTLSHLGPNNRMYADTTNAWLLNSFGEQRIVTIAFDRVDIAPVYYATHYSGWELSILRAAHIRYLIVDLRLSTMLPAKGFYFEGSEEPDENITTPISVQALKKFDTIDGVKRIFDSGNIVIYDVGGLINAKKKS